MAGGHRLLLQASKSQPNAWDKAYVTAETYALIDDYGNATKYYDLALAAVSGPGPEDDARTMLARGSMSVFQSGDVTVLGAIARAAVEDSTNAQSVMAAILRPELRYLARMLTSDVQQALLDVPLDSVRHDPVFYHMTRADLYHHNGDTAQARVEEAENALRAVASSHFVGSGTMARAVTQWWSTEVYLIVGRHVEAANLANTQLEDLGFLLTREWMCMDALYAPIREACASGD
ncbi:MAG: hypothetical protein IH968_04275 [Gemmatimonadetes bacterium]|nr:hypothetical protein [Gemmatimonadota bacterium]